MPKSPRAISSPNCVAVGRAPKIVVGPDGSAATSGGRKGRRNDQADEKSGEMIHLCVRSRSVQIKVQSTSKCNDATYLSVANSRRPLGGRIAGSDDPRATNYPQDDVGRAACYGVSGGWPRCVSKLDDRTDTGRDDCLRRQSRQWIGQPMVRD